MKATQTVYDVGKIKQDFPIFKELVNGKELVYLDNAATTQKPQQVIDAIIHFYARECANIHRGVHFLSERATESYEQSRMKAARFINAGSPNEIIFVRGTTEAINLVAQTFGRSTLRAGDEILISGMEHHSNIVPWQILCEQSGARLRVAPISKTGELIIDQFKDLLGPKTKLVAVTHVSNALGVVNPIKQIIELAHQCSIPVLVDGAQSVQHIPIDVRALDCDFFAFSGHKMYGPTGVGILYGKERLLEEMPPYQGGGDMISSVTYEKTIYNRLPFKFEAGTPHVAGGIGLGAAIDYIQSIGSKKIGEYEQKLMQHGTATLESIAGLRIIGTAKEKAGAISFVIDNIHPHDIGTMLDQQGIAIRTGHHCAQPLMEFFGVPATARASFGVYNTLEDIDALASALKHIIEVFQ